MTTEKQATYLALPRPMQLISGVAYLKHVDDEWTLHYVDDTEESAALPVKFTNALADDNPFRIISAVQAQRKAPLITTLRDDEVFHSNGLPL